MNGRYEEQRMEKEWKGTDFTVRKTNHLLLLSTLSSNVNSSHLPRRERQGNNDSVAVFVLTGAAVSISAMLENFKSSKDGQRMQDSQTGVLKIDCQQNL